MFTKAVKLTCVLCLLSWLPFPIAADNITVTAQVGDTTLTISGYTSPNSLVTFSEDSIVVGTTSSDITGSFSKDFTAQTPGLHFITIQVTDPLNATAGILQSIVLIPFQDLQLSGVMLPPSITMVPSSEFNKSQVVNIQGYSLPNASLRLALGGQQILSIALTTNIDGYYSYTFPAEYFAPGDYTLQTFLLDNWGVDLVGSNIMSFKILVPEVPVEPEKPEQPEKPREEEPLPPTTKCGYKYRRLCLFDTTNKGFINLYTEFQLYFNRFINQAGYDPDIDINADNTVSLTDLSIVLASTGSISQQLSKTSGTTAHLSLVSSPVNKKVTQTSGITWENILLAICPVPLALLLLLLIYRKLTRKDAK